MGGTDGDKRRRIIAAAVELLEEGGPSLSFRAVARAAGVSRGAVQHYFPDRDALVQGCLAHLEEAFAEMGVALGGAGLEPGAPFIQEAARRLYRFGREHRTLLQLRLQTAAPDEVGGGHWTRTLTLGPGVGAVVAPHSTVPPAELGATVKSLVMAIGRFAFMSDEELTNMTGEDDVDAASDAAERYLASCALRLLRPGSPKDAASTA